MPLIFDIVSFKLLSFQDPSSLPPGLPASLINMINKSTKLNNDTSVKPVPKVDTETPAQKQAAAKLALRKQLEKTLLQVRSIGSLISRGTGQ